MTDKEKLEKLKKLADAMYYAAQQLTTDASRLHKAMDEYHKFIIHECKEEPKKCMYSKDNYTDEDRKALCDGCEEKCEFKKKENSASDDKFVSHEEIATMADKASKECEVSIDEEFESSAVNKDLEKEIENFLDYSNLLAPIREVEFIACYFANWQKQQMMAKAVDAVVKIDAGGYPYVDRVVELYDYEKDIPLAKEGDKYKVILIKKD